MSFPTDTTLLSSASTTKRSRSNEPEGLQLSHYVLSSDGSQVDNPDSVAPYQKSPLYPKLSNQVVRNGAKAAIGELVSSPTDMEYSELTNECTVLPTGASSSRVEVCVTPADLFEANKVDRREAITFTPYPGHVVTWHDCNLTKHVTARLVLPSGCGPDDIHASVVEGGMAVEIRYFWPDILLDAMGLYDMYTNSQGEKLYPDSSRKMRGFKARMNEVRSSARFTGGRPQSTYRIPLPFQVQDRFLDVVTPRGAHRGLDIVNHFDEVTGSEIVMLNLEMTSVQTGDYAKREARIPIRLDRHKSKKIRTDVS